MRLGYFTMPVHPMHRNWAETLKEDREAIILADQLGFYDAFMGEHLTDKAENITNSMIFNASLISDTKTIKLATGTSNLSHMHPVLVAQHAAMFDHLSEGRFIFGVSPGALTSDAEALGILEQDRNKMFAEAIDVILAIWERDPPYDIDFPDNRYKVSTSRTQALDIGVGFLGKPYQQPRPEIVGTVVAPFSPGVVLMGKRDFHPLSANFLLSKHLKSHWENYCKGKAEVGVEAPTSTDWRVARTIFVADDDKTAERYARTDHEQPLRVLLVADALQDEARQAALRVQEPQGAAGRRDHARLRAGQLRDPRQRQQGGRSASGAARGDRRLRRDRLCRHGLGRSGARQALDAADGRAGACRGSTPRSANPRRPDRREPIRSAGGYSCDDRRRA